MFEILEFIKKIEKQGFTEIDPILPNNILTY